MVWAQLAAAAVSAAAGAYGADQAADATAKAAKKNADLERQNMLMQLGLIEPQRQLGYGAQSDLASLYGYNLSPYQTGNQLMNPYSNGSNINVKGKGGSEGLIGASSDNWAGGPLGASPKRFGGTINPLTGTVDITNGDGKKAQRLEAELTEYLRTGEGKIGGKGKRFLREIDALRSNGYQYDPNAQAAADAYSPTAGGANGGQAGNMSRFFTSPDYQFRLNEGQRNIGNSFAARGGAASGNALRALTDYNQGQASGEYGNYVNRLLSMSGMGQVANGQAGQAGQSYTNGIQQSNQQQGDARASGIMGTTNSIMGGIGDFATIWGRRQGSQNTMSGSGDIPTWQQRMGG